MGCRYRLSNNKEVFGAETYAILRELIFDRGQESGNCYTIFADSTAAINQIGPGQHLARTAIEACLHLVSRDNEATVWVTPHIGIAGNEEADSLAKEARRDAPTRRRMSTGGRPVSHASPVSQPKTGLAPPRSGRPLTSNQSADTAPLGGPAFEGSN